MRGIPAPRCVGGTQSFLRESNEHANCRHADRPVGYRIAIKPIAYAWMPPELISPPSISEAPDPSLACLLACLLHQSVSQSRLLLECSWIRDFFSLKPSDAGSICVTVTSETWPCCTLRCYLRPDLRQAERHRVASYRIRQARCYS